MRCGRSLSTGQQLERNYYIGASMAPGASPVVIHEAGHNEYAVFYEGSNGALWQESFEWVNME